MAEVRNIQVDVTDPTTNYLELTSVVAEITKVIPKQGYSLVAMRDYTGQEITALIRGRAQPGQGDVGKITTFALSGKTEGNQVKYSGFYNPKDEIPPQYQGKRPPVPAGETATNTSASKGSSGNNRSFALSYTKDLACAGAITMKQLQGVATLFNTYLDTGKWPTKAPQHQPAPVPQEEDEIPEVGGDQTTFSGSTAGTGGFDQTYTDQGQAEFTEDSLGDTPF